MLTGDTVEEVTEFEARFLSPRFLESDHLEMVSFPSTTSPPRQRHPPHPLLHQTGNRPASSTFDTPTRRCSPSTHRSG